MKTAKTSLLFILILAIFYFGFINKINESAFDFSAEEIIISENISLPELEKYPVGTDDSPVLENKPIIKNIPESDSEPVKEELILAKPTPTIIDNIIPFISQAPSANWGNPIFQDACEEASTLMAMSWINNEKLNSSIAEEKILQMANWQKEMYGEYRDTSASDVIARLLNKYFGYDNVELKNIKSAEDIVTELEMGNIIISPMNGQALNNPHFTAPGPERHMVLVKGYDYATEEFITNDPGTRYGKDYRYNKNLFFNAIRDYTSGYHEPFPEIIKNIIIIKK